MDDTSGILDEALERLHSTGPEREDWLSNHAPMAVEALVRRGQSATVHRWLDYYDSKLEDRPRRVSPITETTWRQALGDPRHLTDWADYFARQLAERPWREVLTVWWPRLLPGILASATHGVIRVGHAVRTLLDAERAAHATHTAHTTPDTAAGSPATHAPTASHTSPAPSGPRLTELAEALGYWAARHQPLPGAVDVGGAATPAAALAALPRLADQSGGIRDRLARVPTVPGWQQAMGALHVPDDPDLAYAQLSRLVRAGTHRYATHGHGEPIMLVHAATAPNAVLRTLPALPRALWAPSLCAVWPPVAALMMIYGPAAPRPAPHFAGDRPAEHHPAQQHPADDQAADDRAAERLSAPTAQAQQAASMTPDEVFAQAAAHGDEHVIKFADTAMDVAAAAPDGDARALAAALHAQSMIDAPR
ncbi:questin oxidase family protein [Streptomyces sp. 71268]|uniref:questin oxidase family protein n=1 Tax=Streptomyces sp. 71268 TaxID=3002640 RepID=UPI0023F74D33|nr:questin oxidase family protein [Streptomyces sp. 71268]WEV25864.1 questin oxidase family protein [Streptomyces sp. 71268]